MAAENRLIVLPPSHYCERARWALDAMGVPYTEERWAAGPHIRQAKRLAPGTSLPILVADGKVIQGSDRILDWTGMEGGDPTVEARLETRIGVMVRRFIYSATLADPKSGIRAVLFDGVTGPQAIIGRLMWPLTRRLMAKAMDAQPARLPSIERTIETELDWLGARLAGQRFLVDDRFGRADLTAVSLLSPFLQKRARPAGPAVIRLPVALEALARWRGHPTLIWAQGLYDEQRRHQVASEAA